MTTDMVTWTPPAHPGEPRLVVLTTMQRNVLESMCEGKGNADIGTDWGICEDTVKCHVRRVLRALGADSRTRAVALVFSGQVRVQTPAQTGGYW